MIKRHEIIAEREKAIKILEKVKKIAPKAKILPKGATNDFKPKKK